MKNSINIPLAIPHAHEILLNIKNDYKWSSTGFLKKKNLLHLQLNRTSCKDSIDSASPYFQFRIFIEIFDFSFFFPSNSLHLFDRVFV